MSSTTARRRDEADLIILELVRLTVVDSWSLTKAVQRLLAKRHTPAALRIARARVERAQAEHVGQVADRAAITLARVLAHPSISIGSDGPRGAHDPTTLSKSPVIPTSPRSAAVTRLQPGLASRKDDHDNSA